MIIYIYNKQTNNFKTLNLNNQFYKKILSIRSSLLLLMNVSLVLLFLWSLYLIIFDFYFNFIGLISITVFNTSCLNEKTIKQTTIDQEKSRINQKILTLFHRVDLLLTAFKKNIKQHSLLKIRKILKDTNIKNNLPEKLQKLSSLLEELDYQEHMVDNQKENNTFRKIQKEVNSLTQRSFKAIQREIQEEVNSLTQRSFKTIQREIQEEVKFCIEKSNPIQRIKTGRFIKDLSDHLS